MIPEFVENKIREDIEAAADYSQIMIEAGSAFKAALNDLTFDWADSPAASKFRLLSIRNSYFRPFQNGAVLNGEILRSGDNPLIGLQ